MSEQIDLMLRGRCQRSTVGTLLLKRLLTPYVCRRSGDHSGNRAALRVPHVLHVRCTPTLVARAQFRAPMMTSPAGALPSSAAPTCRRHSSHPMGTSPARLCHPTVLQVIAGIPPWHLHWLFLPVCVRPHSSLHILFLASPQPGRPHGRARRGGHAHPHWRVSSSSVAMIMLE